MMRNSRNSVSEQSRPDQGWYDFAEELPVWKKWWFRAVVIVLGIVIIIFLWQIL